MMKSDFMKSSEREKDGDMVCITMPLPKDPVVAMAYVPFQKIADTYDPEQALKCGTLFPELSKPLCDQRGIVR